MREPELNHGRHRRGMRRRGMGVERVRPVRDLAADQEQEQHPEHEVQAA